MKNTILQLFRVNLDCWSGYTGISFEHTTVILDKLNFYFTGHFLSPWIMKTVPNTHKLTINKFKPSTVL